MNNFSKTCFAIVIAATAAIFVLFPPSVTLSVGDPGASVNQIARYGYGKSIFSLRSMKDADGVPFEPSAFAIGPNGNHLLIWHNKRIDSMRHFRVERSVPNTDGDWRDNKIVDSFTVNRPSLGPYFIGLAIIWLAGFSTARFKRTSIILFTLLLIFVAQWVLITTADAGAFATMPTLIAIGLVFAWLFGRSICRQSCKVNSGTSTESVG